MEMRRSRVESTHRYCADRLIAAGEVERCFREKKLIVLFERSMRLDIPVDCVFAAQFVCSA